MDSGFGILGQQVHLVFDRLSPRCLATLSISCTYLYQLVKQSNVWHNLVVARWRFPHVGIYANRPDPLTIWRDLFRTSNGWDPPQFHTTRITPPCSPAASPSIAAISQPWTPDGRTLVGVANDHVLHVMDVHTNTPLSLHTYQQGTVSSVNVVRLAHPPAACLGTPLFRRPGQPWRWAPLMGTLTCCNLIAAPAIASPGSLAALMNADGYASSAHLEPC